MDEKQFKELNDKLDNVIRLLALNVIQGKNVGESIILLDSLGFRPVEISTMLNRTANQVNVALSNYRKKLKPTKGEENVETNQQGVETDEKSNGE